MLPCPGTRLALAPCLLQRMRYSLFAVNTIDVDARDAGPTSFSIMTQAQPRYLNRLLEFWNAAGASGKARLAALGLWGGKGLVRRRN